jgi:multidrug efflux pump subunit AcrB
MKTVKAFEKHPQPPGVFSPFSSIVVFVVLIIAGLALIPFVSFRLVPSRSLPSITVQYNWPDIPGRIIEMEVTGPLEGAFSIIRGISEISSESGRGRGSITLSVDKTTDLDAVRFEVSMLIRQLYPSLPDGVSRPVIRLNRPDDSETAILTYTINAGASLKVIGEYAENQIKPAISAVKGIYSVDIYGAVPYHWELEYDHYQLQELGITTAQIRQSVQNFLGSLELGQVWENPEPGAGNWQKINLVMFGGSGERIPWESIPVTVSGGRMVRLTEIIRPVYKEQQPAAYHRINGLNTINMVINAEKNTNHLSLARQVKSEIEMINKRLPPGYSIINSYDSTEYLSAELRKNIFRTSFSLLILLAFVLAVSRQPRYLLIVGISLVATLLISFVFYYLLRVEIHLYSLAGITVSLGILIDNTIVMIEHMRYKKDLKVFLAILAATLTTIGALVVVFFLDEKQRVDLVDFSVVVMINLAVCLAIALFFVPALMAKIPLEVKRSVRFFRRKRRIVRFTVLYHRYIVFGRKYRIAFILIALLGFGIPVFWLPDTIQGDKTWQEIYNKTLGSDTYKRKIKPVSDKVLGGSLRLFVYHVREYSFFTRPERTRLVVQAYLPDGSTIDQMNELMMDFENYLAKFTQIEQYQTRIFNAERGTINISFDREHEDGFFPFQLKGLLEKKAIYSGAADYSVYGVGQGFSNRFSDGYTQPSVRLIGYNFEYLMEFARLMKTDIEKHPRIREVFIQTDRQLWGFRPRNEFFMDFQPGRLARLGYTLPEVYTHLLRFATLESQPFYAMVDGKHTAIRLKAKQSDDFNLWDISNMLFSPPGGNSFKIGELAEIRQVRSPDVISKLNQQYMVTLRWDFIGPPELGNMVRKEKIAEANEMLPLGFTAADPYAGYSFWQKEKKQYWLIFLVAGIIFFICAILLESLWQPLVVILMLPLSYIGVFLTFYLFGFNFDQGGYASFLLLSGIVVNSALYILNDMNNLSLGNIRANGIQLYLKAYNAKIIPVILTIVSTVLGLTPFLVSGKSESFWFALAAGTIGGLLFSLVVLVVFLPLFIRHAAVKQIAGT